MKTWKHRWVVLLLGAALAPLPSLAEISGSGTPHAGCPNQIGDLVWRDLNGNGIQDADEPGIGGVAIRLDNANSPALVDVTDTKGHYRFYNLCNGSYWVDLDESTLPADLAPTDDYESPHAHPALDNDADEDNNRVHVVVSSSKSSVLTVDFGFRQGQCNATVGDRVWLDRNRNGIQDLGEKGIGNVEIDLTDTNGNVLATEQTDVDGRYRFDELCVGGYRLDVDEHSRSLRDLSPSPTRAGNDPSADSDGPADSGPIALDIDNEHPERDDLDFGFYHPQCTATVGDRVFLDGNGDGLQLGDQRGLAGVTLTLRVDDETLPLAATRTDQTGRYEFTGLCAGQYHVDLDERTLPGAYEATQALAGNDATADSDATPSGEPVAVSVVADNAIDDSIDFGFRALCDGHLGDRVWLDADANGVQNVGEPGLAGTEVLLRDDQGRRVATAATDDDGHYEFHELCAGRYAVQVDADSIPTGAEPTAADVGNDNIDSDGAAPVWVSLTDQSNADMSIDFGYVVAATCDIAMDARCLIVPQDKSSYVCAKPIDTLTLVWNGGTPVRVVAHKGKKGDAVLADIDPVLPGQELTVSGFAGGPNDVEYEIFASGTNDRLGISKFSINCADQAMNGPEDCATVQGDGKDDKSERVNDWLLEGLVDAGGVLDCTTDLSAASDTCVFKQQAVSCDTIGSELRTMTMAYSGGGCAASAHDQGSKFKCSGAVDDSAAITLTLENDTSITVEPGQVFIVPEAGSDTKIELSNAAGTEYQQIHTSCSKPLIVGNVFGSLTMLGINGKGLGTDMLLVHGIDNIGTVDTTAVRLTAAAAPDDVQISAPLTTGAHVDLVNRVYVTSTGLYEATASADDAGGRSCAATDSVDIDVVPPPPCSVEPQAAIVFRDKEIRWLLRNDSVQNVRVDQLQLAWPQGNGRLEEIKLDGDKIFDDNRDAPETTIAPADLADDFNKRELEPGESRELKMKFKNDAVPSASDYRIDIAFDRGCQITH